MVYIQLNIVTCPTYPDKFIRDNVVAPSVLVSIVIVTLPGAIPSQSAIGARSPRTSRRHLIRRTRGELIIQLCATTEQRSGRRSQSDVNNVDLRGGVFAVCILQPVYTSSALITPLRDAKYWPTELSVGHGLDWVSKIGPMCNYDWALLGIPV